MSGSTWPLVLRQLLLLGPHRRIHGAVRAQQPGCFQLARLGHFCAKSSLLCQCDEMGPGAWVLYGPGRHLWALCGDHTHSSWGLLPSPTLGTAWARVGEWDPFSLWPGWVRDYTTSGDFSFCLSTFASQFLEPLRMTSLLKAPCVSPTLLKWP